MRIPRRPPKSLLPWLHRRSSPPSRSRLQTAGFGPGGLIREDAAGNVSLVDTAAQRSWVNDFQMMEILAFPQLQSLTVEGTEISDQLVPKIAELDTLTTLACRTLISDAGLAQLTGLKSLKVIDLRLCPLVTDAAMDTLASMPNLRAVRLSGTNVTDTGVAALLTLPQLTELDLRNCRGVSDRSIRKLAAKDTLRTLKIGGSRVDDDLLDQVAAIKRLTTLSLDNCDLTDAGVANLKSLPLEDLTIYQCAKVSDQGLAILSSFPDLKRLTLRDVAVDGTALGNLASPEKLQSLNLSQSRITDAEVKQLAALTNLESLNLSETAVTDAAIDTLSQLAGLKQLVLTQTAISEAGRKQLAEALPECKIQTN
jgi:internalin A